MVLIKLMKIPPIRHLLGGHSLSPVVTSPLHTDTKRITKYNCRQCHITLNTDEKSESYEIQIQWSRAMRCIYIFLVTGVASCSLVSVSRFSCVKLFLFQSQFQYWRKVWSQRFRIFNLKMRLTTNHFIQAVAQAIQA